MLEAGIVDEAQLVRRLEALPGIGAVREALRACQCTGAWLVGGAVRDAALGEASVGVDLDLALPEDGRCVAQSLAEALSGSAFPLDAERGAWRVAAERPTTVDVIPLRAPTVAQDLVGRDFTVNAVAYALIGAGRILDPLGGLGDLARRRLRLCSPDALASDPVRVLRAYRFAASLSLAMPPPMASALADAALRLPQMARERVRDELFAMLESGRGAWAFRVMSQHGVLPHLFPEFEGWHGFDQGDYHRHDLAEHALVCMEAAEELAWRPEGFPFLGPAGPLTSHLRETLEAGVTRRALLLLTACLHDVAKPHTVQRDGARLRFVGHEVQGGKMAYGLLRRLRLGARAARTGQRLVAAHLRLFQLAHQAPTTPRARLRYLKDLHREVPEALLLALADERATGPGSPAWSAVAATAGELLQQYWRRRNATPVKPLLRGKDVLALGVPEGPRVGTILAEVERRERAGGLATRAEALQLARRLAAESLGREPERE